MNDSINGNDDGILIIDSINSSSFDNLLILLIVTKF